MATIDWNAVDNASGSQNFKNYAPTGEYTVKLAKATMVDRQGWKAPAIEFEWQEDDKYKYSKSPRHFLSLENKYFRLHHVRSILEAFGLTRENAKKLLESAETDDREQLVKNYQELFNKVAQKHPSVDVIVRNQMRDGKVVASDRGTPYTETEINAPGATFAQNNTSQQSQAELAQAVEDLFGDDDVIADDVEPF